MHTGNRKAWRRGISVPHNQRRISDSWTARIPAFAVCVFSSAALAQGSAAPGASQESQESLEEVVVTGIRASLEKAADIKRNADVIVDSITSEDLGKFPDANVAESLQRISGVSISRNDQGEGSQVTVRGFGPAFNAVLVNGRTLPSQNEGRQFSFDALPAELIAGADVYKSSAASLQDGGIGALMNLRMPRPFDALGQRIVLSAKGTYEDLSGETAPSMFALYSSTFADDRWGVLLSASHQRRDGRTDSGGVQSYLPDQDLRSTDDDGTVTTVASDVFFPRQNTTQVTTTELSRTGFTGVLQFRPTDRLSFTLDALWDRYKPNTETYQLSHYFTPDNVVSATIGANDTVTALTTNENGHTDFTRSFDRTPTTIKATGLNVDWNSAGGLVNLNFDVSTSEALSDGLGKSAFAVIGYQNVVNWSYSGSGMPSLSTSGIPAMGIPANTFTDPTLGKAHFLTYGGGTNRKDEINEAKLDGSLNFDDALVSKLRFGTYFSDRTKRNDVYDVDTCSYCGYWQAVPSSLLSTFNAGSDFLGGGNFPTSWLSFDPEDYVAFLRSVSGNSDLYTPTYGSTSYTVEEGVVAGYVQADFAGEIGTRPWTVNVGVRYVHTELTSKGASRELIDLLEVPGDPTIYEAVYADGGASLPVSAENTYDNLLPSLNAKLSLTPAIVARFSASKSLTRPNLSDLAPRLSYDTLRPNNLVASSGNPDLKPYSSKNLDVSLEWYYSRGGHVTVGAFQKKIDDYIVQMFESESFAIGNSSGDFPDGTATFRVKRPRNVESAEVEGLEIAFQHTFDYLPAPFDGFGISANATFVESPATLSPGNTDTTRSFALEGVGDSQNVIVFYEKGPVGIRVAYNHRDDYLESAFNGEGNEPLFVKGSGQLDMQASYRFSEHLSMALEGSNVTDTAEETFGRYENQFIGRVETGPRYALGLRANF